MIHSSDLICLRRRADSFFEKKPEECGPPGHGQRRGKQTLHARENASTFGLPEERKYPMPDKSHARNAKARASQQKKAGNLTAAEKAKIDRKADNILDG